MNLANQRFWSSYIPAYTLYFNVVMENGLAIPAHWKDVLLVILHKSGVKDVCDNYRGLSLINSMGKLLEKMIQVRLQNYANKTENCIPTSQFGFMTGRSTVDAIYISRSISSSALEHGVPLYKCFVDLQKAYDRVDREAMWAVLQHRGVPEKLVRLIAGLHEGAMATVRLGKESAEPFMLQRGLKQGSILSPLLFNMYMGAIVERSKQLWVKPVSQKDGC